MPSWKDIPIMLKLIKSKQIKADFRTRKVIKDKEGHYVMIKGVSFPRRHKNL